MSLPKIIKLDGEGSQYSLQLFVASDNECFCGHFDAAPIVPGVVQVGWVMTLSQRFFEPVTSALARQINQLKFQRVIQPNSQFTMDLSFSEESKVIIFSLYQGETRYSSGKIVVC